VIAPVQSHYYEGSPVSIGSLRWEGFVEKVSFDIGTLIRPLLDCALHRVVYLPWEHHYGKH